MYTSFPNSKSILPREAPSIIIHQFTYTVHWIQQEEIPQIYFDYGGSVNNADYTIEKWNKPCKAETMLYTPGPSGRSVFLDLAAATPEAKVPRAGWDYTAKFQINKRSWNKFYHALADTTSPPADPDPEEARWKKLYLKQPNNAAAIIYNPYPLVSMIPGLLPPPSPPLRRSAPRIILPK